MFCEAATQTRYSQSKRPPCGQKPYSNPNNKQPLGAKMYAILKTIPPLYHKSCTVLRHKGEGRAFNGANATTDHYLVTTVNWNSLRRTCIHGYPTTLWSLTLRLALYPHFQVFMWNHVVFRRLKSFKYALYFGQYCCCCCCCCHRAKNHLESHPMLCGQTATEIHP